MQGEEHLFYPAQTFIAPTMIDWVERWIGTQRKNNDGTAR